MVRIRGTVVIVHVASTAIRRRTRISVGMAFDARGGGMCTMQREGRIVMVEGGSAPIRFVMALRTIRRESRSRVVRRGGAVVIIHMARVTCRGCSSETICMAFDARRGDVRSVKWECRVIMVEGRRDPARYAVT